jgi:hypothetical protein
MGAPQRHSKTWIVLMQSVRIMFEGVNINWDESKLEAVFWAPTGGGRRNGVKPVIGRQASNWSNSMRAQRGN